MSLNGTRSSFSFLPPRTELLPQGVHQLRVDPFRMWPMVFSWRALYVRALPHVRPGAGGPHDSDTSRNHNYHFALWRRFLLVLKSRCRLIEREGPIDSELQGILIDPS